MLINCTCNRCGKEYSGKVTSTALEYNYTAARFHWRYGRDVLFTTCPYCSETNEAPDSDDVFVEDESADESHCIPPECISSGFNDDLLEAMSKFLGVPFEPRKDILC